MQKNVKKVIKNVKKVIKNVKNVTKNVKNVTKNVKKLQIGAKKLSKVDKKVYSEEEFSNVVSIAKTYEILLAKMTACIGVYLGDEMTKHDLLKEFMSVDRDARKLSFRFNKEVIFGFDPEDKVTK